MLADELRADPDFAELLLRVLRPLPTPPAHTTTPQGAATGPPPLFPPPIPTAAPAPVAPDAAEVRKVLLLGFPQVLLAYVVISIAAQLDWRAARVLQVVILLASAGLAAYGVWRGSRLLLRRTRSPLLIAGTVLNVLLLIRLFLWLVG
ncbi:hypothetical protein ABT112_24465 [Streptomyces sp. NPDC002055]|uniref:hypothetical protein n=1 Tax=Streptomyces sp. NPDC002055 TaxID=3154534 RepID=UPI00332CDE02